jgi:hypothetical protein
LGREIAKSGKPHSITVRDLLKHFAQERRGSEIVRFINYKLRYLGLETAPPFDQVHIDNTVSIIPRQKRPRGRPSKSAAARPKADQTDAAQPLGEAVRSEVLSAQHQAEGRRQAFLRIGLLESANRQPFTVWKRFHRNSSYIIDDARYHSHSSDAE